jgi:hypothetical protein
LCNTRELEAATIKLLYKGKEDTGSLNAYRVIVLECMLFKILATGRQVELVDKRILDNSDLDRVRQQSILYYRIT